MGKACVVFKDGTELVLKPDEDWDDIHEIERPLRGRLTRIKYSRTTPRGVDVFVEVD